MLQGKGRSTLNLKYSDVYLDIEAIIFLEISENFEIFYEEIRHLFRNLVGENVWKKNIEIINEIFLYQDLRMPRIKMKSRKENFKYNIAEYMFLLRANKKIKLKKFSNTIHTVNTQDYGNNCTFCHFWY